MQQSLISVTYPRPQLVQFATVLPLFVNKDPYAKTSSDWKNYGRDHFLDPRDQTLLSMLFDYLHPIGVIVLNDRTFQIQYTQNDKVVELTCIVIGIHIKRIFLPEQLLNIGKLFLADGKDE